MKMRAGKIGLVFLVAASVAEALASVFDINRQPLHDVVGYVGILSLAVATMFISVRLSRTQPRAAARKVILWTANLTCVTVVLLVATFIVMIATFTQSGAKIDPQAKLTAFPSVEVGFFGWTNRLLIVVYCARAMTLAWKAVQYKVCLKSRSLSCLHRRYFRTCRKGTR